MLADEDKVLFPALSNNPLNDESEQRLLLDGRVGALDPSHLLMTCSDFVAA